MEKEIIKFWEENRIFEKSVEKNPDNKSFVFYEGPPTANGTPGLHHVLARAFKDVIPRYKTMKGFRVERKAGWDTHGLPVELQVEKALGLKNKQDIENIVPGNPRESIIEFNKKCKESVWVYRDLWEKLTKRMAYWVDMKNPYVTYENKYIESVWWVIKQIAELKNSKGESFVYKGHKVVPYCYRCGTALSSHEVAQGYQTVKENSITIKFKLKDEPNTYILAWTTTPWTLPGNVALAVGKNIDYVYAKVGDETLILAKDRIDAILKDSYEIIKEVKGQDILNFEYESLYETNKINKKAHYVVAGDFVSTADGTGVVHIAPAFGIDDAEVGKENDLPTLVTVNEKGEMEADVPGKGILVKKKNEKNKYAVDELIIEDLKKRGLFFKEEEYEHEYPFCWRCGTPLIYYAKPSWFIRMSELAEDMAKNNSENINWIPEHIKEGRFGEWLRGVKDWAISRERYWGTPLPIWKCDKCEKIKVVGSVDEIREQLGNSNKLFMVRHGHARNNVERILMSHPQKGECQLTEKGKEQAKEAAQRLQDQKIDIILASPLERTTQTAEIISKAIGVEIIFDERLREIEVGNFEGRSWDEYLKLYPHSLNPNRTDENGIEGIEDVQDRLNSFLDEINEKYQGKNILIVSHGGSLDVLRGMLSGMSKEEILISSPMTKNGEIIQAYSKFFDLHKPFIDDVKFKCECGGEMKRETEVLDVWFDSGSMPTAQFHYPNGASKEDREKIESGKFYPADFISEATDQTRGWFYTLHAISNLLYKAEKVPTGYAFKNVICLGLIMDAKGKKMSKSLGNIVEPMAVMDEYGADMLRWMLFTINQPGLTKKFDVKVMKDIMNRVFRMLWNSYSFFVLYANIDKFEPAVNRELKTTNLLDKWIISEFNVLIKNVDNRLNSYDIYAAGGMIEKFIDNLSNWYIRRSRKRFWKSEDDGDKKAAYETLHYVLVELSKLMAPFTPFVAEEIYKNLTGEDSVHLADFPVADEKLVDEKLNEEMEKARLIITEALQLRAKAGIKVRQPLSDLRFKNYDLRKELIEIIKEEVNVKNASFDKNIAENIELNAEITEDLKLEGQAREISRFIQEMRKEAGYEVENRIEVFYQGMEKVLDKFGETIQKETLANKLENGKLENADLEKEFNIDGEKIVLQIKR
ncbi:MAG TPA: class I tRNA ligase family protein [Candidatus Moranbacteria bacterium]|nr:class I tRNA ligase family protein [Candidatus Moranbacteria bacterium]